MIQFLKMIPSNLTRQIVLARHGQTDFNLMNTIQDPLIPHLTKLGHQQAARLGELFKISQMNFDAVYCSDATRNVETLKEIFPEFEQSQIIKIDSRIQERFHRDLVGKTKEDIQKDLGKSLDDRLSWHLYFEGTGNSMIDSSKYPNDEGLASVKARLLSLFAEIRPKTNILLLGSSVVNQYVLEYYSYGTIGESKTISPEGDEIDFQKNTELRTISIGDDDRLKKYESIEF